MGFSDKMRETLGSEGAKLKILADDEGWVARVAPGGTAEAKLHFAGGTGTARVEGVVMRVFLRHRNWTDAEGMTLTEAQARELSNRNHLTPAWSRELLGESRVDLERDVEPGSEHEIDVQIPVPEHCDRTDDACAVMLHIQADIRGQIDPTATGKLLVG